MNGLSKKIFSIFSIIFTKHKDKAHKYIASKIFKKQYIRKGKCRCCGNCCQGIYVRHSGGVISNEQDFEKLKFKHFFYSYLEIVDKTENGIVFACTKFDKETNRCTVHKHRGLICRNYPQEELFMIGGELHESCGFSFDPIYSFQEVLTKQMSKSVPSFILDTD